MLLRLAQHAHDPALYVIAHLCPRVCVVLPWHVVGCRTHLEEAIARYTPDQRRALVFRSGQDPGVSCLVYAAETLWLLGYPAQALARLHDALALAHELSHPFSLGFCAFYAAIVFSISPGCTGRARARRGRHRALDRAGISTLCVCGNELSMGGALAMQGQGEEGMAQVARGSPPGGPPGQRCYSHTLHLLAEVMTT